MDSLRLIWPTTAPAQTPSSYEDDVVYPLHMLDDTKTLRGITVAWTLRFDDVLDAQKLQKSLSRLLEIGDWRKVGGRLRMKQSGRLEIHSPLIFTTSRPAFAYSKNRIDTAIADDATARLLPKATPAPSTQEGPAAFQIFAASDRAPKTLNDFLKDDTPMLSLHITSFRDATLVALSFPHVLMDVMGQQALLRSWSLVLAGQESQVPPLLGAKDDVLAAAVSAPDDDREPYLMGRQKMSGAGLVSFGARFAWNLFWDSAVETRTIFLPSITVSGLRQKAQEDLAEKRPGVEPPFVSDGDVLTAWMARVVASSLPQPRPLTLLHPINARFRLQSKLQSPGVYIQNMALASFTLLSAADTAASLGSIALQNRRQLMDQSTEGQVLASLRQLQSQNADPNTLCGPSDALLMPFTNWDRADFFNAVDFSPAVVGIESTQTEYPGKLVYHHASSMQPSPTMRNVVVIYGRDREGNYWLTGSFVPRVWAHVDTALKALTLKVFRSSSLRRAS